MRFNPLFAALAGLFVIAAIPALVKSAYPGGSASRQVEQANQIVPLANAVVANLAYDKTRTDLAGRDAPKQTSDNAANWIQALSAIAVAFFTYFLWQLQSQQVGLTTKALKESADATAAMVEANDIAREDTRPILAYAGIVWEDFPGDRGEKLARFVWRNVGKRPVRLIRLNIGREQIPQRLPPTRLDWPAVLSDFEASQNDPTGIIIMPDGQHTSVEIMVSPRHFQHDRFMQQDALHHVYLLARATYTNAISGEHDRQFSTMIALQILPVVIPPRPPHLTPGAPWSDAPHALFAGNLPSTPLGYDVRPVNDPNSVQMT